jgi:hypothetical protein
LQVERRTQPESKGNRQATYVTTVEVLTKKGQCRTCRGAQEGLSFPVEPPKLGGMVCYVVVHGSR